MEERSAASGVAGAAVTPPAAYAVVIEAGPRNYSAYVPDLPGCIATGQNSTVPRRESTSLTTS